MMKKLLALTFALVLLMGCTTQPAQPAQPTTEATTASTAPAFQIPGSTLTVHFIDVGQADCALLECGNAYVLIDGGNAEDGDAVVTYLQDQGVQRLNLVVGTHPHEDHIGGLPDVLDAFPADNVWFSAIPYTNGIVYAFLDAAEDQGKTVQQVAPGQTFRFGEAMITVIGPVRTDYEDVNDLSLVLMVEFEGTRFLFTGDMERIAEIDLLDSGADVKADVLKVGHHGSYSSTSYRFLREVAPTYAVIPVGLNNDYGHPHSEPMSRLRDADVTIYRTDRMGTIVAVSDGEEISFTWENTDIQPWTPAA